MSDQLLNRRVLLKAGALSASGLILAGCQTTGGAASSAVESEELPVAQAQAVTEPLEKVDWATAYARVEDGGFYLPAIPWQKVPEQFRRQMVANPGGKPPGTLVVDTKQNFLYYTMTGGRAMRYGVGLGQSGFEWSGVGNIKRKAKWPRWHPPAEMVEREPYLKKYARSFNTRTGRWESGMPPGVYNALGARALYIYQDGVDTLYRVHGSPRWNSIGYSASSGCVRMFNQDVIDLYERVQSGAEIIVA